MKKIWEDNRGQSVAELALVLPIFLSIVMAIIEFGLLMSSYVTVVNSAREGARYATLGSSDSEIISRIHNSSPNLNQANFSVNITPDENSRKSGDSVTVRVIYSAKPLLSIFKNLVPDIYNIQSQMIMKVE